MRLPGISFLLAGIIIPCSILLFSKNRSCEHPVTRSSKTSPLYNNVSWAHFIHIYHWAPDLISLASYLKHTIILFILLSFCSLLATFHRILVHWATMITAPAHCWALPTLEPLRPSIIPSLTLLTPERWTFSV